MVFVYLGIIYLFHVLGNLEERLHYQICFGSLTVLFWLLAIRDWLDAAEMDLAKSAVGTIAGWEGIICGCSAMYYAMAQVLNEQWGRTVLPIGAVNQKPDKKSDGRDEELENLPV